jgi:hypothetical protein
LAKTLYAVLTPSKLLAQSELGIRGKLPPPPPPPPLPRFITSRFSTALVAMLP